VKTKPLLNLKSLKEQVYEFLREAMRRGEILPGSVIDMEETSLRLGVSKTPLRDALLQLEMEGFVTILPRRKVVVNVLRPEDIKNYYEIIGALESTALRQAFALLGGPEFEEMTRLNAEMRDAIGRDDFDLYYEKNLAFHDVFLSRCGNANLLKVVNNLKRQGMGSGLDRRARSLSRAGESREKRRGGRPHPGRPLVLRLPGEVYRQILSPGVGDLQGLNTARWNDLRFPDVQNKIPDRSRS